MSGIFDSIKVSPEVRERSNEYFDFLDFVNDQYSDDILFIDLHF